jgi:nucleoid-associated protein YgaU
MYSEENLGKRGYSMRRLLAAVLGTGVVAISALPAAASGPSAPGWPNLDRGPTTSQSRATYVVHRGDTLWGIARRHLAGDPSGADVAKTWPRWYRANRHVIGSDPNLIRSGQRLHAPSAAAR